MIGNSDIFDFEAKKLLRFVLGWTEGAFNRLIVTASYPLVSFDFLFD